jgi:hypothetical protein
MIHAPVPPDAWAAEGARSAAALEQVAAALVIGSDVEAAAIVARALAVAQPRDRRVAIGDLVGELRGLVSVASAPATDEPVDDGALGLLQCFRDGRSISEIAQPLTEDGRVHLLPSGGPGVQDRLVMESSRWPRLIAGFREVDALLLLVADARTPGLDALMRAVDGVIAVDIPPVVMRRWPLLATVDRPEPELPLVAPLPDRPAARERHWGRRVLMVAAAMALIGGTWAVRSGHLAFRGGAGGDPGMAAAASGVASDSDPRVDAVPAGAADTITLGAIVNPADSLIAAAFTVELIAANTLAGANSGLAMRGVDLPAPTLAPVLLGADGRPWYRALTGAWRARPEAEAFLASLRDRGLVRDDVGRVLRAPYALLLAEGVPPDRIAAALAQWESRGIPAYALLQDDGRARLFAGAFETPGQSALVALSLRDIGAEPMLAFRTGRTF